MKHRSLFLAVLVVLLLACGSLSAPVAAPTQTRLPSATGRATPSAGPTVPPAAAGFIHVRLRKSGGALMTQLAAEAAIAAQAGLTPYLEFDAEW